MPSISLSPTNKLQFNIGRENLIKVNLDESKRIIFMVIKYNMMDGNVSYGSTIFKKPNILFTMNKEERKHHMQTAENRFNIRPVTAFINPLLENINVIKKVRKLLCKYGVKGRRINSNSDSDSSIISELSNSAEINFSVDDNVFPLSPVRDFESPKRFRYINDEKDIFIFSNYDTDENCFKYGASIYKKAFTDDRIAKSNGENHFRQAYDRFINYPTKLGSVSLIKKYGLNYGEEDLMYYFVDNILNKKKINL